jgi:hypothetical protein
MAAPMHSRSHKQPVPPTTWVTATHPCRCRSHQTARESLLAHHHLLVLCPALPHLQVEVVQALLDLEVPVVPQMGGIAVRGANVAASMAGVGLRLGIVGWAVRLGMGHALNYLSAHRGSLHPIWVRQAKGALVTSACREPSGAQ